MEIWIPLLYPILAGAVGLYFFKHKVVWQEAVIPVGVSILFIAVFRFFVVTSMTSDVEYWGGTVQKVEYYESWNEYIHQICYRECCCDSDGKNCSTESYDCSYVEYHSEYWQITDNNDLTATISQSEYTRLALQFKQQPKFVELNRNYYTEDGDKYEFYWQGEKETFEPMYTEHNYENRVQASHSVYNYPEVSEEDVNTFGLYKYPAVSNLKQQTILGSDSKIHAKAEKEFTWLNSTLGELKELRMWVLIFKDKIPSAGQMQERYWKGGNDNEFIVCIGTDSEYSVNWCHTFSWSEAQEPKIKIRDFVMKQDSLDLMALAEFSYKELSEKYVRKDFKDFSYLTVDPPAWAILWCHIITLVITVSVTIWAISNDVDHDDFGRGYSIKNRFSGRGYQSRW